MTTQPHAAISEISFDEGPRRGVTGPEAVDVDRARPQPRPGGASAAPTPRPEATAGPNGQLLLDLGQDAPPPAAAGPMAAPVGRHLEVVRPDRSGDGRPERTASLRIVTSDDVPSRRPEPGPRAPVAVPIAAIGSNPDTRWASRTAVFTGRTLPSSPDPAAGPDPLGRCVDEHGRLDVGLASQLIAPDLAEPMLLLVLADAIRGLTEAAEDLVRLLNQTIEHVLGVCTYRAATVAEITLRAATTHLGPLHPATLTAQANVAIAYQAAGRRAEALSLAEQVLAGRERLLASDRPGAGDDPTGRRGGEPDLRSVKVALQHLDLETSRATRGVVRTGRTVLPGRERGPLAHADLAGLVLDDHGRVDVDVLVLLLEAEVPAAHRPVVGALAATARSLVEGAEDLGRRLNRATEHLLGVGGAFRPQAMAEAALAAAEAHLGPHHPATVTAMSNRAVALQAAGNIPAALVAFERVLADRERLLGTEHPDTLAARAGVAIAHQEVGRRAEALAGFEWVLADCERLFGPNHADTLTARANLASSYRAAGRVGKAVTAFERVLADSERLLGRDHPDTVAARAQLAGSYRVAGRTTDALAGLERVVADRRRLLGPEHPKTLAARSNLAAAYQATGRTAKAVGCFERILTDRERLLGRAHPDTDTARSNLARAYAAAGRRAEARKLVELVVADRERRLGPEHPDTLGACAKLAACYQQAGRAGEAAALFERVLAGRERVLGADHPRTLTSRGNLAISYRAAGRSATALALFKQVVADCERLLGPTHPETVVARAHLAAATRPHTAPPKP